MQQLESLGILEDLLFILEENPYLLLRSPSGRDNLLDQTLSLTDAINWKHVTIFILFIINDSLQSEECVFKMLNRTTDTRNR